MKPGGILELRLQRGELGAAVALAALGGVVLAMASRMPDGSMGAPGPGMFPLGLGGGLVLVGIGLVVRALRLGGADADLVIEVGHRHVWISLAALVVLGLVFEPLGYPISIFLFMLTLLGAFAKLGRLRTVAAALVAAGVSWWFFVKLLGVNLPLGLLQMNG